ncbi:P-loop NTPase [Microbacterium sp. SSW1-49]|uniref:P-loop NTPase n=1 Tax=Microbacterium croceum TaxID=2851645 RepID=A0ABT0FE72_9MICO|nr:P-loop NTPase [Microbacterium croceum]MCK2036365.1 P-loop NTPase [Microbacterium croceum]
MTRVLIAIAEPRARELSVELEWEGLTVVATAAPAIDAIRPLLADVEALVVPAVRSVLTSDLIAACDRAGVRILPVGETGSRALGRLGIIAPLPADASGWEVAAALLRDLPASPHPKESQRAPRVIAVWGPHGAPGRSTVAVQLSVELARAGRRTALIDADTVAPSLALLLGISDDAPGIAAACRRAELGGLDARELTRLASTIETSGGDLDVLPGINRPTRWPELSASRLTTTLQACRLWADETIVDVSGAFDADDEATYDMAGPRRHAATTASVREADAIIAVAAADPVGISRLLRDHAELRRLAGTTPTSVVINRMRSGPLGLDARGQIRRTLERFAGITDVAFLPFDQRAADAALLHARPMSDVTPRSAFVASIRGVVASLGPTPAPDATGGSSRGSSRVARRLRSARAAQGA